MTVTLYCMNSQRDTLVGVAAAQARRQQQRQQPLATTTGWVQPVQQQQQQQVRSRLLEFSSPSPSTSLGATKRLMTPTNTDSPLRRSEAGLYRDGAHNASTTTINDDEAERREARRRTILRASTAHDTSSIEDNETLKKCLEMYNGNKLSRDNAWSLSLIDTLSSLLDRHHKSLSNFKVAGSSLEASSKVYGLRVDSVHTDVLRMSAGLNAQKFTDRQLHGDDDDDDDVATGGEGGADPNASAAGAHEADSEKAAAAKPKPKPKRARKAVSTVTKNKETLNGRLDTVPLQDPVFGKLNSIVGSINSSTRLMNNILLTSESELRLRTTFRVWDAETAADCDYTADTPPTATPVAGEESKWASCERLLQLQRPNELQLRPLHGGYVISDTPEAIADDKDTMSRRDSLVSSFDGDFGGGGDGGQMSMAFDINAECEPVNEPPPMLDVDYADLEELTTEERTAVNNCRGLRKAAVVIEDLRPVDASSKLEYSYRPLDKISQFWAGPSHWKFKRNRPRPSSMLALQGANSATRGFAALRASRRAHQLAKKRSKQLQFEQNFDEQEQGDFVKLGKYKLRKANFQKKWDQRKLKLPTDLQLDADMFYKFKCMPGVAMEVQNVSGALATDATHDDAAHAGGDGGDDMADDHFADNDAGSGSADCNMGVGSAGGNGDGGAGDGTLGVTNFPDDGGAVATSHLNDGGDNVGNNTVLEIATSFDGAPSQVTKIIVPFAKRAKVIDMKNLKRCCTQLINKQIKVAVPEETIPVHPIVSGEHYMPGMASFQHIYENLPELLTQSMVDALSPSVAFYSVLHLANDYNLRLIPQKDLEDFKIRQLMEEE